MDLRGTRPHRDPRYVDLWADDGASGRSAEIIRDALCCTAAAGLAWGIALPSLYIFNSLTGSQLRVSTTLLAALVTTSWGGLAMIASIPINWFFTVAFADLIADPVHVTWLVRAVNLVVFTGVGVCMTDIFGRVMEVLEPDRGRTPVLWLAVVTGNRRRALLRLRALSIRDECVIIRQSGLSLKIIGENPMETMTIGEPLTEPWSGSTPVSSSSTAELVELILKDQRRLNTLIRDDAHVSDVIPRLLAVALAGFTVFGIAATLIMNLAVIRSRPGYPEHTGMTAPLQTSRWPM